MDENLRMTQCPRCQNEEFDDNANYCRVCGLSRYNICEGEVEENSGFPPDVEYHNNYGNARYCEVCGKKTLFFIEGFLKSYIDLREEDGDVNPYSQVVSYPASYEPVNQVQTLVDDDGDLPF